MSHGMSGKEGGGEDTVAWASWPPPQIYVFEMIRNWVVCSGRTQIFSNQIVSCFISHSNMFHCMSGIEGGGQDTVAWVSWPPPSFTILK